MHGSTTPGAFSKLKLSQSAIRWFAKSRPRSREMFGIKYPILLAGMAKVSNPALAAAVTNAGGLGVIGGAIKTPEQLKKEVDRVEEFIG